MRPRLLPSRAMSEAKISDERVRQVARLARLAMTDSEVSEMRGQLDAILGYVDELNMVDVEGVEPTFHSVPVGGGLRDDDVRPSMPREAALAAAPASEAGGFAVPKVLEGDS